MVKMKKYKVLKQFRERFIYFGRNSGIHGINYVFRANANLFTRTFWLLAITASLTCIYMMLQHDEELGVDISFTPDTRYLHWTTVFPAVTLCEVLSTKQALKRFLALYPDLLNNFDYDHRRFLTELLYANGQCSKAQCSPCGSTVPCDVPWREIINKVHKKCDDIVTECFYNGQPFPCCQHFRAVDSQHGTCFSFNTLLYKTQQSLFVVNRTTGPGVLTFRLRSDVEVSVHSPEELSTTLLDSKQKVTLHMYSENTVDFFFSVVEIDNDPQLYRHSIDVRECRFRHELLEDPFYIYPVYSYGACLLAYGTKDTYQHCGCVHPVRDIKYKTQFCNYTGINCWQNYEEYKSTLATANEYSCLPSCEETELKTVHLSKRWDPEGGPGILMNIRMVSLPTLRYRRALMSDNLDLVVTVGGIVGLFLGASILSLIEVFYLILRSPKAE